MICTCILTSYTQSFTCQISEWDDLTGVAELRYDDKFLRVNIIYVIYSFLCFAYSLRYCTHYTLHILLLLTYVIHAIIIDWVSSSRSSTGPTSSSWTSTRLPWGQNYDPLVCMLCSKLSCIHVNKLGRLYTLAYSYLHWLHIFVYGMYWTYIQALLHYAQPDWSALLQQLRHFHSRSRDLLGGAEVPRPG